MLLTFEFKSVEEAAEFLKGLTAGRQPAEVSAPPVPATGAVKPSKDPAPVDEKPSSKKRSPKPKQFVVGETIPAGTTIQPGDTFVLPAGTGQPGEVVYGDTGPEPVDVKRTIEGSTTRYVEYMTEMTEVTLDTCRDALANLFESKGRDVCKAVLGKFKAAKVGGLKPEQYIDFIRACQAA